MKLSAKAIEKIISDTQFRMHMAVLLGISDQHFYKGLKANKEDGFLTKASVLKIIKQETGLQESEILTEAKSEVST